MPTTGTPTTGTPTTGTLLAPPGGQNPGEQTGRRVVLIDPREERRAITSRLIERCPALTVVGLAADLAEAETQIRVEQADVALVEIQMPVAQGLDAIRSLREQFPELRIIVSSFHDDSATRETARLHGADGYLRKPLEVTDLLALLTSSARAPSGTDQADPQPSTGPRPQIEVTRR